MIEDHSGPIDQAPTMPQPPIVLPSYEEPTRPAPIAHPLNRNVHPAQLIRRPPSSAPRGLFAKLGYLWRKDPAYKVLMVAIGTVLISSIVCAALIGNMLNQPKQAPATALDPANTPAATAAPAPTTASTLTPTPISQPTPAPAVQPTTPPVAPTAPAPTPSPAVQSTGPLSVQLTNVPAQAKNNSNVSVGVTTNVPGATVRLVVTYTPALGFANGNPKVTDANGNATFSWHIRLFSFRGAGNSATAHIVAFAQDQHGHVAQSQPVDVQVSLNR